MNEIVGAITVVMAILIYIPYLRDTFIGKVKPHPFSWVIWVTLTCIAYAAQISDDAGPGAWMNAVVIVICLLIFIASLRHGLKEVKKIDFVVFGLAIIAIVIWVITNDPFWSVILVCIANTIGYIPTLLKAHRKPYEDAVYMYGLNFFRHALSIVALANYSILTALFPFILTINNGVLAVFLLMRRRVIQKEKD